MEVVDKNVESNNKMLDYLKSIDVNSINTHEEFELDDFIASVVMINTNYTTLKGANTDYIIYLIFQDKQTNKLYGKFFTKEFSNKDLNSVKNILSYRSNDNRFDNSILQTKDDPYITLFNFSFDTENKDIIYLDNYTNDEKIKLQYDLFSEIKDNL